jgi:hypothetical protein
MSDSHIFEVFARQIAVHEAKIRDLQRAANTLAESLGVPLPYDVQAEGSTPAVAARTIRADQFANYGAPSTAARAFLEWRGKERGAAAAEEIYDALVLGGFAFDARNPESAKQGLRIALAKDQQIHKLANGAYGLAAWYPNASKGRRGRASDAASGPPANDNHLDGSGLVQEEQFPAVPADASNSEDDAW